MQRLKIFVSSTVADFHAYRQALDEALLQAGHTPLVQERFGAMPADPKTACDHLIDECDVFVGLYGFRYGYVPEEGGDSITELEYSTARRLGKRCLCYLAREDLRAELEGEEILHGPPEESQMRFRQQEFRLRIDVELVRAEFSDHHELVGLLLADLGKLQGGAPLGWAYSDVYQRWSAWLERQAYFFGDIAEHLDTVEPRLASMWRDFVHTPLWHQRIDDLREAILALGQDIPSLREPLQQLERIACDAPYHVIYRRLSELPFPALLRPVSREVDRRRRAYEEALRSQRSPDVRTLRDRFEAAKSLHRNLMTLARQAQDPNFRRAFLVLGSMGSGKSHFIAHLASSGRHDDASRDQLLLPLRTRVEASLGDTVLDLIRQATGLSWRGLEEFDAFLAAQDIEDNPTVSAPCLVIALDDLHLRLSETPGFGEDLERFIVEHTHLHHLAWLVTLQDTNYRQVVRHEVFWQRFTYAWRPDRATRTDRGMWTAESSMANSFARSMPIAGGWLYLDELNGGDPPLGLEVLRTEGFGQTDDGASASLAVEWSEGRDSVYRLLASPFVAWVVLALDKGLDPRQFVNLNFVDFVEAFWKRRLLDMGWSPLSAKIVADQAVVLVARCLFDSGDFSPLRDNMVRAINDIAAREAARAELQTPEGAEKAIEVLERGGLVRLRETEGPIHQPVEQIELSFEPLWQWHLARQIMPATVTRQEEIARIVTTLRELLEADTAAVLREGVVEFLLLLASREPEAGGLDASLEPGLWRRVLQIEGVGAEAVWFAGPKARLSAQRELVSWLEDRDLRPLVRKSPFGVLYFLNALAPDALAITERLRLLQPFFGEIRRASLGSFYLYAAERFLRQIDDNDLLLKALPYFRGCEELGFAPTLAEFAVERAFENAGGDLDALFDLALAYLRKIDRTTNQEYRDRNRGKKWIRHFFYEWFLEALFRRVSNAFDHPIDLAAVFDRLEKRHWYWPNRSGLGWSTSLIMEREANISLGHWYRASRRKVDLDGFESIVRRLGKSSRPNKRVAFFLLYHAGAIGGSPAYQLVGEPLEELRRLFFSPAVANVASYNLPFFAYQLHPLSTREKQRLEELRRLAADRHNNRRGESRRRRNRKAPGGRSRQKAGRGGKPGRGRKSR